MTLRLDCIWTTKSNFVDEIRNNKPTEVINDCTVEGLYSQLGQHNDGLYQLANVCKELNIPLTLLSVNRYLAPNLVDWNDNAFSDINVVDFPQYWISKAFHSMVYNNQHYQYNISNNMDAWDDSVNLNTPINRLFISMNNLAKPHRCRLMDYLAKYDLIDRGAISWHDILRQYNDIRHTLVDDISDSQRNGFVYNYWTPKRMYLNTTGENTHLGSVSEKLPVEYHDSFMQIVGETEEDYFFMTEKTATPLLLNKIFLVASCVNHHKILQDMGFLLYDELFDYSFDSVEDTDKRMEMIAENVNRYKNHSNTELMMLRKQVEHKLRHNRKQALYYTYEGVPKEMLDVVDKILGSAYSQVLLLNDLQNIWKNRK